MAHMRRCQSASANRRAEAYRVVENPIVDGMGVRLRLTQQIKDRWTKVQGAKDTRPLPTLGFSNPSPDMQQRRKLAMSKEQRLGLDAQMREKAAVVQMEQEEREREQQETDEKILAFQEELKDREKAFLHNKMQLKQRREVELADYLQTRKQKKDKEKAAAAQRLSTLAEELQVERTAEIARRRNVKADLTKERNQFLTELQLFQQKAKDDKLNEEPPWDESCWLMSPGYHQTHKAGLAKAISSKMERRYDAYLKVAPPTWDELARRDQARAQEQFDALQEQERQKDAERLARRQSDKRKLLSMLQQQCSEKDALRQTSKADDLHFRQTLEADDRRAVRRMLRKQRKDKEAQSQRRDYLSRQSEEHAARASQPIETQISRQRSRDLGDVGVWS